MALHILAFHRDHLAFLFLLIPALNMSLLLMGQRIFFRLFFIGDEGT